MLIAGIFPANEGGSTVPHMTTILIAGIFPVEVEAYPETAASFTHILAIFGSFFSLALAAILLSRRFKQDENWRSFHSMALILALTMLATSIWIFLVFFLAFRLGFEILILELLTFTSLLWLFLTAARLRLISG